MPNTPNVNFQVTNLVNLPSTPAQGISFVEGITVRGPFGDPNTVINSWSSFVRIFGGLHPTSLFPLLCKRALDKGAKLRVNRVGHYTNPASKATLDATLSVLPNVTKLTFDADFVTANVIDLDVDGNAIVSVPFNTDNNTTLADLATQIALDPSVAAALVISTGGANDREIMVLPVAGTVAVTSIAVTLGASQAGGTTATITGIVDADGNPLFTIENKYKGADYNNWLVDILPPSNSGAGYFDLELSNSVEPSLSETYTNLTIPGNPTIANSHYLDNLITGSKFHKPTYFDLSSTTGQVTPLTMSLQFAGGSDGTTPAYTDYIGDSAGKTGFYAFDEYDDSLQILVPEADETWTGVHAAGSAYAANRKDLIYWAHLTSTLSKSALIAARQALLINSQYTALFSGGLKVIDPVSSAPLEIPEFVDILANAAKSDENFGEWFSFAGLNRGQITNVNGVVTNYGSPAAFDDLNDIANAQVNMAIIRNNAAYLWGLFSAQLGNNPEKFLAVVRLIIFIQKSLKPLLEQYLEDPNDVPTWKRIFFNVKPFLDGLVTGRALAEYLWDGDQDVSDIASVQVNDPTDVQNGIYKVNFFIKPIAPIQEIKINIIITPAGVSFEEATTVL